MLVDCLLYRIAHFKDWMIYCLLYRIVHYEDWMYDESVVLCSLYFIVPSGIFPLKNSGCFWLQKFIQNKTIWCRVNKTIIKPTAYVYDSLWTMCSQHNMCYPHHCPPPPPHSPKKRQKVTAFPEESYLWQSYATQPIDFWQCLDFLQIVARFLFLSTSLVSLTCASLHPWELFSLSHLNSMLTVHSIVICLQIYSPVQRCWNSAQPSCSTSETGSTSPTWRTLPMATLRWGRMARSWVHSSMREPFFTW